MNPNEIATKADIEILRKEIHELKSVFEKSAPEKKILRSANVREMLNISDATLQRLRTSGTLPAKKVNGTWFYELDNIKKLIK
ncbi:helix-turn-helix domain-containing protein [Sediminibacterium roseum]|uniref:Helix-turn-helix domain-containing protein n=1 Tax=Sediminibacterium roseum TaxID=1978412 RepID=A0ABW9ZVB0_9BACT|nr:helix-turn-helix domain-containing protein [Sediminibacterium roseum]NCI48995.1 helix-turn-helix domain-containing protein [Sediminibacterium roseum]